MSALGIAVATCAISFIACYVFQALGDPRSRVHNSWDYAFAFTLFMIFAPSLIAVIILGSARL
jgi:hypothetical protein